jgi:hypothetical protein
MRAIYAPARLWVRAPSRRPATGRYGLGKNQLGSLNCRCRPGQLMNAPPETHDVEVIKRFLLRFSDLMSNGSNSSNLLLAAQLLEANVKRANDSEGQLRQERSNCVDLTAQLAALSSDSHILAPISILRLARSQFESLARAFEKSGDVISQAMCEASAATLERILEAKAPRNKVLVPPPIEASRERL